jgi:hypothetical protein
LRSNVASCLARRHGGRRKDEDVPLCVGVVPGVIVLEVFVVAGELIVNEVDGQRLAMQSRYPGPLVYHLSEEDWPNSFL